MNSLLRTTLLASLLVVGLPQISGAAPHAAMVARDDATPPATPSATQGKDIHVGVNGMVCDFCAQTLKKTFAKQAAVQGVDISLEDKLVTVHLKPGQTLDDAMIRKTISDAGYAVTTIHRM